MTNARIGQLKRKLMESRFRISSEDYEFSLPLFDMDFIATKTVWRISANEKVICFDPDWLQKLDDVALDFILSHELMHIALGHINRPQYYTGEKFHLAADIVANANLEQLGWMYDKLPKIGNIYYETFFPRIDGKELTSLEAFKCVPFDPANEKENLRRKYMIDSDKMWGKDIKLEDGVLILSPDDPIPDDLIAKSNKGGGHYFKKEFTTRNAMMVIWTDDDPTSSYQKTKNEKAEMQGYNNEELAQQIETLRDMLKAENSPSLNYIERMWKANNPSKANWRRLLNDIVQENILDYTFSPPDKRYGDSDIFLPDYNIVDKKLKDVLFMVDTSGSISENMLNTVFSELKGAVSQFENQLNGILGFFDSFVYPLVDFRKITDLYSLKPPGGGGTDYYVLFDFIRKNIPFDSISSIVIFTDGQADFPPIPLNDNIPVLWLFSKDTVKAPWGRQAVIK